MILKWVGLCVCDLLFIDKMYTLENKIKHETTYLFWKPVTTMYNKIDSIKLFC